jgi:hypothetical protein
MFADTFLPHRAGITSGKAYCGLVGSPLRHEYAVMGPSTNLSARLMGKAKQGELPNLLGCVDSVCLGRPQVINGAFLPYLVIFIY